jgi:hypothetical protein
VKEGEEPEEVRALQDLVRRHQVGWEVWPEYNRDDAGRTVQIGFDLMLTGTYDHDQHEAGAGCPECVRVYEDLRRVARWILPRGETESAYELGAYDGAIHYPPERESRPEIELPIRILHRHGFERPVDRCEESCLSEMEEKLAQLGAPRKRWHEPRPA